MCPSRKNINKFNLPEILKTPFSGIPQTLILLASSNAELSLTPRYAEVAVTELCPSKIPHLLKNTTYSGITWVFLIHQ